MAYKRIPKDHERRHVIYDWQRGGWMQHSKNRWTIGVLWTYDRRFQQWINQLV